MKKTALLGLVIAAATQANAATVDFTNGGGDFLWSNSNNWVTDDAVPVNRVPNYSQDADTVTVNTTGLIIDASKATASTMNVGGLAGATNVTLNANKELELFSKLSFGGNHNAVSTFTNNGTVDVRAIDMSKNGSHTFNNYGDIELSAASTGNVVVNSSRGSTFNQYSGDITCFDLSLDGDDTETRTNIFNMSGGSITGAGALTTVGTSYAFGAEINLSGGEMEFASISFFAEDSNKITVTGGSLTVAGDVRSYFTDAIGTQLFGVDASQIAYDSDLDVTRVIPEPGTYALFAGLLGLTSVMLRRRN